MRLKLHINMAKISILLVDDQHRRHVNKETTLLLLCFFCLVSLYICLYFLNGMFSPLMLTVKA